MRRRSSPPRAAQARARCATRHRPSAGCRLRHPTSTPLICHAYKWLCAPRGVSFLTVSEEFAREMPPLFAGWYAGAGPMVLVLRPRGRARLGCDALRRLAGMAGVRRRRPCARHVRVPRPGRAAPACGRPGIAIPRTDEPAAPERPSAIVTWADPDGCDLARLTAAGIVASGRAGRARVAFHLFNDERDVDMALVALGR